VSKPGKYLLTGMLAIMLAIAPLRAVMALSMDSGDQCESTVDHGNDLQQPGQASTNPDTEHSSLAQGQDCCDENDSTCTTDCQACTSLSYAPIAISPVKTPRQHFPNNGFKTSAVPTGNLTPLLRPPATLHS